MENDDLGPVGERDYPAGCIPAPRRRQGSRVGALQVGGSRVGASVEDLSEGPSVSLPADFYSWDAREQCMERRRIYTLLRQYFEGRKTGKSIQRPDLPAMKVMNKEGLSLKFEDIGTVPGVLVGDTFDYRTEMYVVGLHRQVQAGIAYTHFGGELLATSIVASGGYEDDEDYGDVLHYSGQGGNDYKGEKRQVEDQDQKEKVANEALLNSYKLKKPVRVSRGYGVDNTHGWTKSYSYDGLYTVSSAKLGVGTSGHKVYKFKLKRNPDQPELRFRRVQFQGSQVK